VGAAEGERYYSLFAQRTGWRRVREAGQEEQNNGGERRTVATLGRKEGGTTTWDKA